LLLEGMGEDPDREGLAETPDRIAEMYEEIFAGVGKDPRGKIKTYQAQNRDEMILVKDIPFHSVCEHHLLPFFGRAHIAYIPKENKVTGFAALVRVVETLSKRPQLQERLTTEVADAIVDVLDPRGLLVVVEAEHLCLTMRGVKKPGSRTLTSAVRGAMRAKSATRAEAFALIKSER
jgi:GTP cyclohydrolase I